MKSINSHFRKAQRKNSNSEWKTRKVEKTLIAFAFGVETCFLLIQNLRMALKFFAFSFATVMALAQLVNNVKQLFFCVFTSVRFRSLTSRKGTSGGR